jgi:hypothetical protein
VFPVRPITTTLLLLSLYITAGAWADIPVQPAAEGQAIEPASPAQVADDAAATKAPSDEAPSQAHTATATSAAAIPRNADTASGDAAANPDVVDPVALKKAGYKIVNENGQTLYCRKDISTGSHLKKTTTCLTERELAQLRDSTRREVEYMQKRNPPRQDRDRPMPATNHH